MLRFILLQTVTLLISCAHSVWSQQLLPANGAKIDTALREIINHFDQLRPFNKDTVWLPTLLNTESYRVVLADSALHLRKQRRVLTNPFSTDKYPLSYSILYKDNLVSLFAPGYFSCYTLDGWQRNLPMEKQLNTKHFERHWLIDDQLIGLAGGRYWQFTRKRGWQAYEKTVPFGDRPKLFEDNQYLVYNQCNGEFGGQVFFFDKRTQKTYWTEATCAVWVRHTTQGYEVLSSLGHMMGGADKQLIVNPSLLPLWTGKPTDTEVASRSDNKRTVFKFRDLQLFGGLEHQNQVVHLLHTADYTCLATVSTNTFTVVDPLFNDGLYTHQPVSTMYNGIALINLDFYGIGRYREVACLLVKDDQIMLIDWNEVHSH